MIGERLKKARIAAGLTQETLAVYLGISASAISQFENGKKSPRLNMFLKIVNILHVSPEYILGYDVCVTCDDTDYIIRLSKDDLRIISEIKKYGNLYQKLVSNPENVVLAWNKRINMQ